MVGMDRRGRDLSIGGDWLIFLWLGCISGVGQILTAFSHPIHGKTFVTYIEEDEMLSAGGFMARLVDFLWLVWFSCVGRRFWRRFSLAQSTAKLCYMWCSWCCHYQRRGERSVVDGCIAAIRDNEEAIRRRRSISSLLFSILNQGVEDPGFKMQRLKNLLLGARLEHTFYSPKMLHSYATVITGWSEQSGSPNSADRKLSAWSFWLGLVLTCCPYRFSGWSSKTWQHCSETQKPC